MPELLQRVMRVSPAAHFVRLRAILALRGAGLDLVWHHFAGPSGSGAWPSPLPSPDSTTVSLTRL